MVGAREGVDRHERAAPAGEDGLRVAEHPERGADEREREDDDGGEKGVSRSHASHTPDIPP